MKKICFFALLAGLLSVNKAQAVEVGDILYNDGTISNVVDDSKIPIGLFYWVSNRKDFGYIMALNQPDDMTYANAMAFCQSYQTLGTKKGDWSLPNRPELIKMGKEVWNGTLSDKFTLLNNKLASISIGEQLKPDVGYWARSASKYQFTLNKYGVATKTGGSDTGAVRCVKIY